MIIKLRLESGQFGALLKWLDNPINFTGDAEEDRYPEQMKSWMDSGTFPNLSIFVDDENDIGGLKVVRLVNMLRAKPDPNPRSGMTNVTLEVAESFVFTSREYDAEDPFATCMTPRQLLDSMFRAVGYFPDKLVCVN